MAGKLPKKENKGLSTEVARKEFPLLTDDRLEEVLLGERRGWLGENGRPGRINGEGGSPGTKVIIVNHVVSAPSWFLSPSNLIDNPQIGDDSAHYQCDSGGREKSGESKAQEAGGTNTSGKEAITGGIASSVERLVGRAADNCRS